MASRSFPEDNFTPRFHRIPRSVIALIAALPIAMSTAGCGVVGFTAAGSKSAEDLPARSSGRVDAGSAGDAVAVAARGEGGAGGSAAASTVLGSEVFAESGWDREVSPESMFQRGVASWYGADFHGKKTANGEIYDMDELTAAHKTLPFNTIVRVENLRNGRTVDVRINDRGPYVGDRVIDLSRKAAADIDMIGPGTAPVNLVLLETGDAPVIPRLIKEELFTIQIASYENRIEAERKASGIKGSMVEQRMSDGRKVYRVYYGTFPTREGAMDELGKLNRQGISGFVKQYQN